MGNCCATEEESQSAVDMKPRTKTTTNKKKGNSKKAKKGATLPDNFTDQFVDGGETEENIEENLWDSFDKLKDDKITDEASFHEDEVVLKRKGKTMPLFKKEVFEKVKEHLSKEVTQKMTELGPFEFRKAELKGFNLDELETKPVTKSESGLYYLGQWNTSTDTKEGKGIGVNDDGTLYEGFWKADLYNGAGRIILPNGNVYQGQWKEGKQQGYGILYTKEGNKYKGWWTAGKYNGQGFAISADGELTYRGDFKQGVKKGKGIFGFKEGTTYEGEVDNNKKNGTGSIKYHDGRTYTGDWKDDEMHGKGLFTWPNGSTYEGDYFNGLKHGYGKYKYPDGRTYEGEWADNKQHGTGTLIDAKGKSAKYRVEKGEFKEKLKN